MSYIHNSQSSNANAKSIVPSWTLWGEVLKSEKNIYNLYERDIVHSTIHSKYLQLKWLEEQCIGAKKKVIFMNKYLQHQQNKTKKYI